jgi:hypothetical protein
VHNDAQNISQRNVFDYSAGTTQFAEVAKDVSADYKGSDAFSHARVADVDSAFTKAARNDFQAETNVSTVQDGSE